MRPAPDNKEGLQGQLKTIRKRQTVIDWHMHEHEPYSPKLLMYQGIYRLETA
ncbi:hypothetical protein PSEUDO8AS_40263 [Pseudomonas sp. 8AS]|nr:hypothetical protein PSEUDO8AS_40263 [Pseudomonas sp. 8AS]